MELVLVRHAVAEERDLARWPNDADRPLTGDGEERFRGAARGLAHLVPAIDELLTSPFARARRTAELLSEAGWPAPKPLEVLASGRSPLQVVEELDPYAGRDRLALVGHEPMLSELASVLLTGSATRVVLEMRKGAACLLERPEGPRRGRASLRGLLSPKVLRGLGR